jgi:hypothetical protein
MKAFFPRDVTYVLMIEATRDQRTVRHPSFCTTFMVASNVPTYGLVPTGVAMGALHLPRLHVSITRPERLHPIQTPNVCVEFVRVQLGSGLPDVSFLRQAFSLRRALAIGVGEMERI